CARDPPGGRAGYRRPPRRHRWRGRPRNRGRRTPGYRQRPAAGSGYARRIRSSTGRLLALLVQPFQQQAALERRQVVDEHLAFQVVHLVLDAYRQRAFGLDDDLLAVDILRPDLDPQRPGDVGIQARKRQAAFLVDLRTVLFQDLRIDERQRLVAPLAHVRHQHALVHVDLGGGQADAVGG